MSHEVRQRALNSLKNSRGEEQWQDLGKANSKYFTIALQYPD